MRPFLQRQVEAAGEGAGPAADQWGSVILDIGGHLPRDWGVVNGVGAGPVRLLQPVQRRRVVAPQVIRARDFDSESAAPFAAAVRRSGGQLVANGRIPVQALLGAIEDELEDEASATSDEGA